MTQAFSSVVLHSGGLDSSVCLLLAKESSPEVLSLGIDYGQRHRIELEFAQALCNRLGIARRILRVEWDKPQRTLPTSRNLDQIRAGISPGFLPGRNLVFLSLAVAQAATVGASLIWIGVNSRDFSGYPDCRLDFIESFQVAAREAVPGGASVVAPLASMSKPEIAREAMRLGLQKGETWSCYLPRIDNGVISACGICDACVLEAHAWNSA